MNNVTADKTVVDFGNFIKDKRISKGLSQAEVARLLNISQQAYCRYEQGTRDPGLTMIRQIADVLGFQPGDFFNTYI